ncbi:MAG TPA: SCO family protein [Cytophagaceae bacterium]|jgi:protein SCO1/2|nr:SCO family protein [Cytophagaceae bacterium]
MNVNNGSGKKVKLLLGVLAILLIVIPTVFFGMLMIFGKNHYNIPVYFPLDSVYENGKYKVTSYHVIPDYTLIDQNGKAFKGKSLKGNIYIADFFFTSCPGTCPKMTNQLKRVQEAYASSPDIKIVSYTVDPGHDSVEVLKNFAKKNDAIPGKWFFVTGAKDSIYNLAQTGYYISAGEERTSSEAFLHSTKLILVDKEGRIRGYYDGIVQSEVDRLITEIKVLLHEYSNQ